MERYLSLSMELSTYPQVSLSRQANFLGDRERCREKKRNRIPKFQHVNWVGPTNLIFGIRDLDSSQLNSQLAQHLLDFSTSIAIAYTANWPSLDGSKVEQVLCLCPR